MKVSIAQFADVISKELSEFREEKIDNMKKIIDDVAKETTSDLKQTSPKRTGEYAKHWANKTVAESALKKNKWFITEIQHIAWHICWKKDML